MNEPEKGCFAAQDCLHDDFVTSFKTIENFLKQMSRTGANVLIKGDKKIRLYMDNGFEAHEYLVFDIKRVDSNAMYYLRLDHRHRIEGGSSQVAAAKSSLASSSSAFANDEILLTKQFRNNTEFAKSDAILRCQVTFGTRSPEVRHLLTLAVQIRSAASMKDYRLYWSNCWAFARTIFHKLAKDTSLDARILIQDDKTEQLVTGDLDEFLLKLMRGDVMILGGYAVGMVAAVPVGMAAAGNVAAYAALGAAAGPIGVAAGILAGAGVALAGGVIGCGVHDLTWETPFAKQWKSLCITLRTYDMTPLTPYQNLV